MTIKKERKNKYPLTRPWNEFLVEQLQDGEEALEYLISALDENDLSFFLKCLRKVVEVRMGMSNLAKKTGISRVGLYKIFSNQGNPELDTLDRILTALGFKLSLTLRHQPKKNNRKLAA